jgi:hypothetical protein
MQNKSPGKNLFLSINLKGHPAKDQLAEPSTLVNKHSQTLDLRRFSSGEVETEATFHVDIKNSNALFGMERELRQVFSEIEISLIDHNQDPTF